MELSLNSRVWVYQSSRFFTPEEAEKIQLKLNVFNAGWNAHGANLYSDAYINENLFVVMLVDETKSGASGCSIDSSVRVIKELEQEFGVDFFNRTNTVYKDAQGQLHLVSLDEFKQMYQNNELTPETLVYNNLINTKADLQENWLVPVSKSWHGKMV